MQDILVEYSPLEQEDCFYLVDRWKERFDYPMHRHGEMELNFVENCEGARRIVGDNREVLGRFDLALIGANLPHYWEQHECPRQRIREITIKFSSDMLSKSFLQKTQMRTLSKLFENAQLGMAFGMSTILKVYNKLDEMTHQQPDFYRVLKFLEILYELSLSTDCHMLSSKSFSHAKPATESRRIKRVQEYIDQHYKQEIRLQTLADMVGMTAPAFSRFFRQHTGQTVSDYIIEIRLGLATRKLVDTAMSVSEICYECGFNNVSNFNRLFRKKHNCNPSEFREDYKKNKLKV